MSDLEQDQLLERFIALARSDDDLRGEIKSAINQEQVISIAAQTRFCCGFLGHSKKMEQAH